MSYTFKMPDIGEGVVEAEITAWHVKVGDTVNEDDPVADAMTDKATIELTAPVTGEILSLGCEEGDMLAVGSALAVFDADEDAGEDGEDGEVEAPTKPDAKAERPKRQRHRPEAGPKAEGGRVLAAPAVRARAKARGLDIAKATPTGPGGRVVDADLDALEAALQPQHGETRIKVIGMRRAIAEAMAESKRKIPHFTYVEEIDVTELEAFRARANDGRGDKPKLSVLPLLITAMSAVFRDWPQFNARYDDALGHVSRFDALHLGIATQTDQGLVVPVLKDAHQLNVWQMAAGIARLAEGVRAQSLGREDLTGSTTTLTSLGPLGGIVTTPVINRPEVAIFGPNKIRPKLEMRDGEVVERLVMNYSVSCDHRVIDGYDCAAMMQDMKALLEDPVGLFLA